MLLCCYIFWCMCYCITGIQPSILLALCKGCEHYKLCSKKQVKFNDKQEKGRYHKQVEVNGSTKQAEMNPHTVNFSGYAQMSRKQQYMYCSSSSCSIVTASSSSCSIVISILFLPTLSPLFFLLHTNSIVNGSIMHQNGVPIQFHNTGIVANIHYI